MTGKPTGSAVPGPEEAIAVGLVKLAIERGGKPGIAKLKTLLTGETLMVVGPPRAGKSTFLDYVRYGIFQHAQETETTYQPQKTQDFRLTIGPNRALSVSIKTAVDMPGEPNPIWVAGEVFDRRPHALVIMLDLSAPLDDEHDYRSTAVWLRKFCDAAEQRAHALNPKKNRLRSVVVALNKADLVDDAVFAAKEREFRGIMEQRWKIARGSHSGAPLFRRCIAVVNEDKDQTRWADAVLVDIAKSLTRTS